MTYPLREQIIEQSKDGTLMTPDQRLAWDAAFRRVLAVIDALSHPQTGGSWYRESDIDALQARATAAEAEVARLTAERDALRAEALCRELRHRGYLVPRSVMDAALDKLTSDQKTAV